MPSRPENLAAYAGLLHDQQTEAALIFMPGSGAGLGSVARAHGRFLLDFDPLESWLVGILRPGQHSLSACATPNYFLAAHAARHRPDLGLLYVPAAQFGDWLAHQLGDCRRLGLIGGGEMPAWLSQALPTALPGCTWLPLDLPAHRLRQRKSPLDLARHQAAAQLCDAIFARLPALLAPRPTAPPPAAPQVQELIRRLAWDLGCQDCRSWISYGPQGSDADIFAPHMAQQGAAQQGETARIVTIGLMLTLDGAFGHAIRCFSHGRPDAGLLAAYAALRAASDRIFAGLRPCVDAAQRIAALEAEARGELAAHGFSQGFAFRLGHALGYAYEDPPLAALFQQPFDARQGAAPLVDETVLAPSLFELHPSLHLPGQGLIALGDMLLVEPEANRWLLTTPRAVLEM